MSIASIRSALEVFGPASMQPQADPIGVAASALYSVVQKGRVTATTPEAGEIGEVVKALGATTANTTAVWRTVAAIVLTPGDWDVDGFVRFSGAPTGASSHAMMLSLLAPPSVSAQVPGDNVMETAPPTGAYSTGVGVSSYNVTTDVPITVYLASVAVFTGGLTSTAGRISARRRS